MCPRVPVTSWWAAAPNPADRMPANALPSAPIPAKAGIGLRGEHYREVADTLPDTAFFEVHSENFFGRGGVPHRYLQRVREHYPLSLHGVGLSLGSTDPLDRAHVARIKELSELYQPALVSEHLSWGSAQGRHFNDLFPLPYTEEALAHLVGRIEQVQESLGRRILIENVSSYLEFEHSTISEWEFVAAAAEQADCGILLDVNNIYVNSRNHGFDGTAFVDRMPADRVHEIHLAGHTENDLGDASILIDTHNRRVCAAVWELYRHTINRLGPRPTLIEWDTDLPPLPVLLDEARIADEILDVGGARAA